MYLFISKKNYTILGTTLLKADTTSDSEACSLMTMKIVSSPAMVPNIYGISLLSILYAMLLAYPGRVFITPMLPEKFIEIKPGTCIISFT